MSSSRILVVEDEALVAADLEQRLQHLGYQVAAVVDSGEDAVAVAGSSGLDLALMDIRLRGPMSGIEAAQILRHSHQIPVVYLTSHADGDTLARAGRTEPFGFIVKPFQEHDLHATIEMAFHRARAEERLRKMERWMTTTLSSIGDGVIATDLAGRVTLINRMAEQLTGWSALEAAGRLLGEVFDVRTLDEPGDEPGQKIAVTFDAGAVGSLPDRMVLHTRTGGERRIEDSAAPIRDDTGRILGIVIVFRDRTEQDRLLAERQRIERKLQEAQRLESLGLLAGGIAHDFNNLLTGIVANTSLAMEILPAGSEAHEHLQDVETASQRAAELVRQMLAYSGRGRFIVTRVDLSVLVNETARLIRVSIGKSATLNLALAPDLPPIAADAAQIRQVVMNLVINAAEALPEGAGTIDVGTRCIQATPTLFETAIVAPESAVERYVQLEVRDTGSGISPENLRRIFEPFFSTKFTGRGLGLAAVTGIVRSHEGALVVESEIGAGTVFRVLLPIQPVPETEATPTPATLAATDRTGTILVVDDEPLVRAAAERLLQALGFSVETATGGRECLQFVAADPHRYRLILLDLSMPQMSGYDVFTEVRRIAPDVRVVLMSGYREQQAVGRFNERDLAGFLQKPFDSGALLSVLRAALA